MITKPVTEEQLTKWKELWRNNAQSMQPNRISGKQLEAYFCDKYNPSEYRDAAFADAVRFNAEERYGKKAPPDIVCYRVGEDVLVGIERNTGFFHIESETVEKCVPIYDDLYGKRGLGADDLQNYVLTGQYLELTKNVL